MAVCSSLSSMHCSSSSGKSEFSIAEPFTGKSADDLKRYIHSLWQNFVLLPNYDEEKEWDVYLLYKSFFGHYSMLFLLPGHIEGFLIHLLVENQKTKFYINYVNLRKFKNDLKALSLGTTKPLTAACIITNAHSILASMGYYNLAFNNCQDYCKKIADNIEVSKKFINWKDADFAEVFAGKKVLCSVLNASVASVGLIDGVIASTEDFAHMGPHVNSCLIMTIDDLRVTYDEESKKDI